MADDRLDASYEEGFRHGYAERGKLDVDLILKLEEGYDQLEHRVDRLERVISHLPAFRHWLATDRGP